MEYVPDSLRERRREGEKIDSDLVREAFRDFLDEEEEMIDVFGCAQVSMAEIAGMLIESYPDRFPILPGAMAKIFKDWLDWNRIIEVKGNFHAMLESEISFVELREAKRAS